MFDRLTFGVSLAKPRLHPTKTGHPPDEESQIAYDWWFR